MCHAPLISVQLPTLNDMADLDNEGVDLERERVPRRKSPDFMGSIWLYIYIVYIYIYYQSTIIYFGYIYGYNLGIYIYI